MRILFVNPKYDERQYRYKVNKLCPPLGMAYMAGVLSQNGHSVKILDMEATQMAWNDLSGHLSGEGPELIGIHGTTPVSHLIARVATIARQACPDATIVVGGPHATLLPEPVLNDMPEVDYVLRGEAEFTMRDLVRAIEARASVDSMSAIPGIGLRRDGELFVSPEIARVEDLDSLPLPAHDLLPLDAYHHGSHLAETGKTGRVMTMLSSRGCPYECVFCSAPVIYGRKFRARSAKDIVDEMTVLVEEYDVTHVIFYDAAFMIDQRRVERICHEILDRSLEVSWRVRCRADKITEPQIKLMKEAGCTTLAIGVETGVQRLLDILNKKTTLEEIERAFEIARRVGMWTVGYFILGIPTETRAETYQTVEFAKKLDPDWALFTHATPLPGTKLAGMVDDKLLTRDWAQFKFSANSPVVSYDDMDKQELQAMMDYAFCSFYLRGDWLKNRLRKVDTVGQVDRIIDSFLYYLDKVWKAETVLPEAQS